MDKTRRFFGKDPRTGKDILKKIPIPPDMQNKMDVPEEFLNTKDGCPECNYSGILVDGSYCQNCDKGKGMLEAYGYKNFDKKFGVDPDRM